MSAVDQQFLRRAMRLAMNGRGRVEPNPMVGCVLTRDGRVIGQGYHRAFGQPHAEPTALGDCVCRGDTPAGSTAYVTLEPCCHVEKKTPPCVPQVVRAGVSRVVIGCLDPNPQVNGQGVAMLRDAGIEVDVLESGPASLLVPAAGRPLCAGDFRQLIAPFTLGQSKHRPYITLKWAQTADGFVAGPGRQRIAITSELANAMVHRLRARSDAILIGSGTLLMDDPLLTARNVDESRLKHRIVLDRRGRLSSAHQLLKSNRGDLVVVTSTRRNEFASAHVIDVPVDATLDHVVGRIKQELPDVHHLLIEPGPTLAREALVVADRLWVFGSGQAINDGLPAAGIPASYVLTGQTRVGPDTLSEYLNTALPTFYANHPSADFVLVDAS